jgi:nitrate/nitrite transporter NarK
MRFFYAPIALLLTWLLYFSLAHVLDREGVASALLAPSGNFGLSVFVLVLLVVLRFLGLVVLPSLLCGWLLAALGARLARRIQRRSV